MNAYATLTKPGIIFGNAVTLFAGFTMASRGGFDFALFFAVLAGLSLIIAAGCVCNNVLDREMDAKMARTKNRALVLGLVSVEEALYFAIALGICGTAILGLFTNYLTLALALFGFAIYAGPYTLLKPRTTHATLIGSVAGAMPPVVGYAAASGTLDLGALLIFLIVTFWQMPHFFAIAIYRLDDYAAASIPILPVAKGMRAAKVQIVLYAIAYLIASTLPALFGYAGVTYLAIATALGAYWLYLCIQGFWATDDRLWARSVFRFSLLVVLVTSALFLDRT